MERVISFLGLFAMLFLGWLMSPHKRVISVRVILGGLVLQFAFAAVILNTYVGQASFAWLGEQIREVLEFVDSGAAFVFGAEFNHHQFAFKVLPTIIFFSSLMSVLYYLGVMQAVVKAVAVVMRRTLNTSGAESLSAAANIFIGQTEAPLVVRPYIATMTQSELMAVMVGGFATIAGGVLAAYVSMGIDPTHLITASVISAPAALVMAKVTQPEVERPLTLGRVEVQVERGAVNLIHAAARGAADGAKLAVNVAAMLIAFLALIALANAIIGWAGRIFGQIWSLELGLGYLFAPLAWLMGVEPNDCFNVGVLLGKKLVANEFIAYQELAVWIQPDSAVRLSARSQLIATYALCGFSNFASIGIQIGGIGPLAPQRQADLARLGLRAMLAGTLACFMTACVAGTLL
jgi:CNT family concentrative nucleoside transporter